jgi:Na+-translocating ferredoxin:NAD+ oxidoreductase RnfE subunit
VIKKVISERVLINLDVIIILYLFGDVQANIKGIILLLYRSLLFYLNKDMTSCFVVD